MATKSKKRDLPSRQDVHNFEDEVDAFRNKLVQKTFGWMVGKAVVGDFRGRKGVRGTIVQVAWEFLEFADHADVYVKVKWDLPRDPISGVPETWVKPHDCSGWMRSNLKLA